MRQNKFLLIFLTWSLTLAAKTVTLSWEPVEDEIRCYRIYWGTQSGVYSNFIDVGTETLYSIDALQDSVRYYIAVTAVDYWGNESDYSDEVATSGSEHPATPDRFELQNNYPNPFNSQTILVFALPEKSLISLTIYNTLGQKIRTLENAFFDVGLHQSVWNGEDNNGRPMPSGAYIGVLMIDNLRLSRRMLLVR